MATHTVDNPFTGETAASVTLADEAAISKTLDRARELMELRAAVVTETYDDASAPTSVTFHGASCKQVKAESGGKVAIELGCKTLVK